MSCSSHLYYSKLLTLCLLAHVGPVLAARPLEELHEVADGKRMYSNYRMEVIDKIPSAAAPVAVQVPVQGRQPGSDKPVTIPDSLVAVQAFIMWEEAGKPQVCCVVRGTCVMLGHA